MTSFRFGLYDVNATNTNRLVRFRVEPYAGNANAAMFGMLKGHAPSYPHYGRLTTAPTANQNLAQLRTSLVARALSRWAVLVGIELVNDTAATGGLTANFAPAVELIFETYETGVFYNNLWSGDTTLAHDVTTDIADTVGTGGANSTKTKSGLNTLVAALSTVSYDGGTTGPFGALSSSGAVVLPDGTTTSSAPVLSATVSPNASGLTVVFVAN